MGFLFPKPPRPPRIITQPLPKTEDTSVQEAAAEAAARRRRARGFRSTVLSQQFTDQSGGGLKQALGQ